MLEPYDGKLSRTVLRREGGGNTADPADEEASQCVDKVIQIAEESGAEIQFY